MTFQNVDISSWFGSLFRPDSAPPPARPQPSRPGPDTGTMDYADIDLIIKMLSGERFDHVGFRLTFRQYASSDAFTAYTSGGYNLLFRLGNTYILNLDVAAQFDNNILAEYRPGILAIADHVGAHVIPVGETALSHGPMRLGFTPHNTLRCIHRAGMEAVFTFDAGDGEKVYLSGYDTQETPPRRRGSWYGETVQAPGLYFLCRLPCLVKTVDEAREALKPESVKRAEAQGIEVKRQGDLFAIKSELTTADIEDQGGVIREYPTKEVATAAPTPVTMRSWGGLEYALPNPPPPPLEAPGFYGTAHITTLSAQLPNGLTLGSGTMHHDPKIISEARAPDHAPLKLGDGWWLITPNTVPKTLGARQPTLRHGFW